LNSGNLLKANDPGGGRQRRYAFMNRPLAQIRRLAIAVAWVVFVNTSSTGAGGASVQTSELSSEALKEVTPDGYKVAQVLPLSTARDGREFI
jgi:hypothetical protein